VNPAVALVVGGLVFGGADGLIAQKSAQLFWNNTDNQLAVGTNVFDAATTKLRVVNGSSGLAIQADTDGATPIQATRYTSDTSPSVVRLRKARGTLATPAGVLAGDSLGMVSTRGCLDTGAFPGTATGSVEFYAQDSFTASAQGTGFRLQLTKPGAAALATVFDCSGAGNQIQTQQAQSGGSPVALQIIGGALSALAAGVEANDVDLNIARTVQFATGALATQRAVRVRIPTYAFVGASTLTTAATLAIEGAPVAGANATITTARALWIQAGGSRFDGFIEVQDGAGGSFSTTGAIRFPSTPVTPTPLITQLNHTGTANLSIIESAPSNVVNIGTDNSFTSSKQPATLRVWGLTNVNIGVGAGLTMAQASSTEFAVFQQKNFAVRGSLSAGAFGGGIGVMCVGNASTIPSSNPTNAVILYTEAGALKGRSPSGNIQTLLAAEPHCPRCGRDLLALEGENANSGEKLSLCVPCLVGALERAGVSPDEFVIERNLKEAA
jgi:hypothetical protein